MTWSVSDSSAIESGGCCLFFFFNDTATPEIYTLSLHDALPICWEHRVESVSQDADGVRLVAATPDGAAEVRAEYAIGCDGARSAMRKLLGVEFPGHSFEDRFLIADVRAKLPFPNERRFFFDPSFNPGRQVLVHPQPDSVWRIDWQIPADVDVEEERSSGRLGQRIRAVVGDTDYQLVWLSTYRFHQRVAASFQVG